MTMTAEITQVTDASFNELLRGSQGFALVDFWASDCLPCDLIQPLIDQIAVEHAGDLVVLAVHANAFPETVHACGIMSAPTLVLFKDGSEVSRLPVSAIAQRLQHESKPGESLVPRFMAEVREGLDSLLGHLGA